MVGEVLESTTKTLLNQYYNSQLCFKDASLCPQISVALIPCQNNLLLQQKEIIQHSQNTKNNWQLGVSHPQWMQSQDKAQGASGKSLERL